MSKPDPANPQEMKSGDSVKQINTSDESLIRNLINPLGKIQTDEKMPKSDQLVLRQTHASLPVQISEKEVHFIRNTLVDPTVEIKETSTISKSENKVETSTAEEAAADTTVISDEEVLEIKNLLHDDTFDDLEEDHTVDYTHLSKHEIAQQLSNLVKETDISLIKVQYGGLRNAYNQLLAKERDQKLKAFIADGGQEDEFELKEDVIDEQVRQSISVYKQNKAIFLEEQEQQKIRNLELKNATLDELRELINSEESLKHTYDKFKELQDNWKQIGQVPSNEVNELWKNYHFLVEKFFDKVKINKELRDLDLKKNLESKIELCEKAEELLLENSILKSFKLLQQYHQEWKDIGPVPLENKEEIWERFKSATDKINARRKDHYTHIKEEQEKNLESKLALCAKIENLVNEQTHQNVKEWQNTTQEVNELFTLWKSIGRAPKAQNDIIWERFKSSLDQFFQDKKQFFDGIKDQQMENYNLKLDLCLQAEALKDSEDWKNTTNDLIRLQKEWKEIGPVPRKYADKVWKRFRKACDTFFNRKDAFFKDIRSNEQDNLKKKEELIEKIRDYKVSDQKKDNLEALKTFQREWMDIGFVPIKAKNKIQTEYRKVLDVLIEKMQLNQQEMTISAYKDRVEGMQNDPAARAILSKERSFLNNKISKLRDDINLWENNIEFLAKSKQANIVRAEFEKKIQNAKNELKIMESKLRMIH